MKQQFKAILIDPLKRSVEAISYTSDDVHNFLDFLYKTIGTNMVSCSQLPNGDTGWYDDEGLLKPWDQQGFFQSSFFDYPLAGRWVIVRMVGGMDRDRHYDCRSTVPELYTSITWVEPKDVVVPSPHFVEYDDQGNITKSSPVDGGSGSWSFDNQP